MKKIICLFTIIFSFLGMRSQISVVNISLMPYSITPEGMLGATLMNSGSEQQIFMISKLYNLNNELLISVKSSSFAAKSGLNAGYSGDRKASVVEYGFGNQANYVKTSHSLPSGVFKVCIEVHNTITSEPLDEFCDEIQSEYNQYLYLVFPMDHETILTKSPLLTWSHSEPFNLLTQGEFYRMIVCEIKAGQSPDEAILINSPMMIKDYVTTHSLQYPYEAKPLENGKSYAWQVQKIANNIVQNKTETWEFKTISADQVTENNYTSLRKVLDASFYQVENNKVFFKFQEEYSSGQISCVIYNSKREHLKAKANNESEKKDVPNYKTHGFNQYEIDLNEYDLEKGFYTLEVKNYKNEIFLLKFYVR